MASKCDLCGKSFASPHGVSVHKVRSSCGGGNPVKNRSSSRRKKAVVGKNGESGKDAIRRMLSENPKGMAVCDITADLRKEGFKFADNYVAGVASKDPDLIRLERGSYRLKKNKLLQSTHHTVSATTPQTAATAVQEIELPREALLVRIDSLEAQNKTLETQNRALQDAHITLMRGMLV